MKENNKIYTAADFARYHGGTMPVDEMHALEKAALEDPFLEDALEGYAHTQSTESDINELRSRLSEKAKKKNIFFFSSVAQNTWWRIAALFILICGAGYLFYNINYDSKKESVARVESKTPIAGKDSIASSTTDSDVAKNDVAMESQQANLIPKDNNSLSSRPGVEKKNPATLPVSTPAPADNYMSTVQDSSYKSTARSEKADKETDTRLSKVYELKGTVTDEKGKAVAWANIKDDTRNKATYADTAGRFLLRSKDSSITATISAVGYASKNIRLKKDQQPTIAMNKSNAELSEVVVTGYGSKKERAKKAVSASRSIDGKVAGVQITPDSARVSTGQEKFDQYLKENTPQILDDNNEQLTGEVLLSFTINKKGRPKNIRVVRSTCEACEPDAIKLLQNGPGWLGKKESPGAVTIQFLKP